MTLSLYRLLQPLLESLFGLTVFALELLIRLKPSLEEKFSKLIQTYRMRRSSGVPAYLEVDYESLSGKKPIWIHAASGEFEYAKPLVRALKQRGETVFVTYFSPTYRGAIEKDPGVAASCPLPLDNASEIRDLIKRLNPRCLMIARTDTWPNLIYECAREGVPTLLFSATFHALSGRVGGLASLLTKATYPYLTSAHGVTDEDCRLLESFGVKKTVPAGDTRYDQVLARLSSAKPLIPGLRDRLHQEVLVAGSVWREDIENILPGLTQEIEGRRNFSAILVPHEVSTEMIDELSARIKVRGLKFATYSQLEAATGPSDGRLDILIVDKVGILAELYQIGQLAFVGGSFRKTVHSVMEPLAAGCITFVGPKHLNNREAIEFQFEQILDSRHAPVFTYAPVVCTKDSEEFREKLHGVLMAIEAIKDGQPDVRGAIQKMVKSRGGASEKALEWLEGL